MFKQKNIASDVDDNAMLNSLKEAPDSEPAVMDLPLMSSPVFESNSTTPTAVIGPKIRFKGELVGEEDLLVQGQIDGTIDLTGNTLTVGKQGVIKASVLADNVIVEGTVEGDIFGRERIVVMSSSNVKGNMVAENVTLEDGAKFRGSIDMDTSAHKEKFEKTKSVENISRDKNKKEATENDPH